MNLWVLPGERAIRLTHHTSHYTSHEAFRLDLLTTVVVVVVQVSRTAISYVTGRSRAGSPAETTHDQPSPTSTTSAESRGKRALVSTHRLREHN